MLILGYLLSSHILYNIHTYILRNYQFPQIRNQIDIKICYFIILISISKKVYFNFIEMAKQYALQIFINVIVYKLSKTKLCLLLKTIISFTIIYNYNYSNTL